MPKKGETRAAAEKALDRAAARYYKATESYRKGGSRKAYHNARDTMVKARAHFEQFRAAAAGPGDAHIILGKGK